MSLSPLGNLIPKIDGFSPLATSAVIPFMELQTRIMGIAFGTSMQIGKRLIGSMSNEKFNALTSQSHKDYVKAVSDSPLLTAAQQDAATTVASNNIWKELAPYAKQAIDEFLKELPKYRPLQDKILQEGFILEKDKALMNVDLYKWSLLNLPKEYLQGTVEVATDTIDSHREKNPRTGPNLAKPKSGSETSISQDASGTVTKKHSNEQLSENNIKRLYETVKSNKKSVNDIQAGIDRTRANPNKSVKPSQTQFLNRMKTALSNNLKVLNAAQMSHKKNFGKYVTLL